MFHEKLFGSCDTKSVSIEGCHRSVLYQNSGGGTLTSFSFVAIQLETSAVFPLKTKFFELLLEIDEPEEMAKGGELALSDVVAISQRQ